MGNPRYNKRYDLPAYDDFNRKPLAISQLRVFSASCTLPGLRIHAWRIAANLLPCLQKHHHGVGVVTETFHELFVASCKHCVGA